MESRSMTGKTVLVTGASSGIGLEAGVQLAKLGAEVVMVARDAKKGDAALADAKARSSSQAISMLFCDFSSQASIRALAAEVRSKHARLDVLVNNAGTVSSARQVTVDGVEQTFAVNHLGYFLLTSLLLDLVEKSAPARIVNVASVGHRRGTLDFDDLGFEKGGYWIMGAYTRSKLANVLFTRELAKRLAGKGVTVNCLHPGAIATSIWAKAPWFARPLLALGALLFMESAATGGSRIVHLAASPEVEGKTGGYYEKNRLVDPAPLALDASLASKLWDVSTGLVHL
jgi:retinol dehydrogenase-14